MDGTDNISTTSSSSSEDELDYYQYQRIFGTETRAPKTRHRRLDWSAHVAEKVANGTFTKRYHMTYPTFQRLVAMLDISVNVPQSRRSTSGNRPIEKPMVVGGGLRYLGGSKKSDVADVLGISDSSTDLLINRFIHSVLTCEALHIKTPSTPQELRTIANGFRNVSTAGDLFKGAVGAIDGWLVTIEKPSEVDNVADYHSGHYSCYGLNVIAICDSRLRFTYTSIAGTGRTGDSRAILRLDRLRQWLDGLPEEYFLIGDNAFTLSSKMLVPFSGAQRTQQHKDVYNYYLSQLRIRIEMAFGRMTTKWRIFRRPLDVSLAKASDIIMASMMLHNFVIENDGLVMNNLETDVRRRYGVDPLEGRDTDNNGFLPAIDDEIQVNLAPQQHPDGHRRNTILQEVIDRQLMRPHHNIERNG